MSDDDDQTGHVTSTTRRSRGPGSFMSSPLGCARWVTHGGLRRQATERLVAATGRLLEALCGGGARSTMALTDRRSCRTFRCYSPFACEGKTVPLGWARVHRIPRRNFAWRRPFATFGDSNPMGCRDVRPWLDHGTWQPPHANRSKIARRIRASPTRLRIPALPEGESPAIKFPWGPVHAGIIEPGTLSGLPSER
jgi:hypothetical protein